MLCDMPSVKIAELDTGTMKKANLNAGFAQLGVMPDNSIQEASPHFLLITSYKLYLTVILAWDGSTGVGKSWPSPVLGIMETNSRGGAQMARVTASLSKSTGYASAENTCNHTHEIHKILTLHFCCMHYIKGGRGPLNW